MVIKALDPYWIRIRIRIGLQHQPLDPGPEKMHTDPQPCFYANKFFQWICNQHRILRLLYPYQNVVRKINVGSYYHFY